MPETQLNCPHELGAGSDRGRAASHCALHPEVQRTELAWKALMRKGLFVCLFPLTATSNSWIMVFVFGILEGMIPFPLCVWIFSLLPTYPLGPRRTLESTIVFWPLSPPLSGATHKDCCLNSLGQEWKAVPRVSANCYLHLSASSHSSVSCKSKKNWWSVEGFWEASPGQWESSNAF